jgi:hypothetical protein
MVGIAVGRPLVVGVAGLIRVVAGGLGDPAGDLHLPAAEIEAMQQRIAVEQRRAVIGGMDQAIGRQRSLEHLERLIGEAFTPEQADRGGEGNWKGGSERA